MLHFTMHLYQMGGILFPLIIQQFFINIALFSPSFLEHFCQNFTNSSGLEQLKILNSMDLNTTFWHLHHIARQHNWLKQIRRRQFHQ